MHTYNSVGRAQGLQFAKNEHIQHAHNLLNLMQRTLLRRMMLRMRVLHSIISLTVVDHLATCAPWGLLSAVQAIRQWVFAFEHIDPGLDDKW